MSHLHKTMLNRERLVEVIACGPPATEMPHFDKYAYEDKSCYGLLADDLGQKIPPSCRLHSRDVRREDDYCSPSAEKLVEECERDS